MDVESAVVGEHNVEHFQNEGHVAPSLGSATPPSEGLTAQPDPPEAAKQAPQPGKSQAPEQQKKSASKKAANPDFKELQETGSWGKMSRSEFHVVMGVIAMVVIAVVVLVVLVLTHVIGHKGNNNDRQQLLTIVLSALTKSNVSELMTAELPDSVTYYENKGDGSAGVEAQAMSWLLYSDHYTHDINHAFVDVVRFALAATFYSFGGNHWFNVSGWLTSTDFCGWNGILCDLQGNVTALDLHSNNLVGKIPPELGLITSLVSLNLANNHLSGPLPGDSLGAIPHLGIISVQNNSLTGTIPGNLNPNPITGRKSA